MAFGKLTCAVVLFRNVAATYCTSAKSSGRRGDCVKVSASDIAGFALARRAARAESEWRRRKHLDENLRRNEPALRWLDGVRDVLLVLTESS